MSHLHPERLAALADGEPTAAEAAHLSSCSSCAHEIAAHRRLLMLAWQERETLSTPLVSWESLSESLRREGLLRDTVTTAGGGGSARGGGRAPWWLQAAAAVVILAGGMHIGRMTSATSGGTMASSQTPANSRFAENSDSAAAFSSPAEAISVLQRAERDYRQAMMYLAGQDSVTRVADDPDIYRARLAALDEMAGVALDAVHQAPQDPLMNRIYLNTLGTRDATLRQLGEKLPENVQLQGF